MQTPKQSRLRRAAVAAAPPTSCGLLDQPERRRDYNIRYPSRHREAHWEIEASGAMTSNVGYCAAAAMNVARNHQL